MRPVVRALRLSPHPAELTGGDHLALPVDAPLYRARLVQDASVPAYVRDASYPPLECAVLHRANRNGEPVFYASCSAETTFAECRVAPGDVVLVGTWRCVMPVTLRRIGYSAECTDDEERACHEIFATPGHEVYHHTSDIAGRLMGQDGVHGIAYPSVATSHSDVNVALTTQAADTVIRFERATLCRCVGTEDVVFFEELRVATSPDGVTLRWD